MIHENGGGDGASSDSNSGTAAQPPDPDDEDPFGGRSANSCDRNETVKCSHVDYGQVPSDLRDPARKVIQSMDTDGTLPPGVRQGGTHRQPGMYGAEGLPRASRNYYVETDILLTKPGSTRPESGRLIFGGRGEVWYTDHYKDGFVQIRGRIVDADEPGSPALWVDLEAHMPWLPTQPYLLESSDLGRTLRGLESLGFRVVRAYAPKGGNLEESLLIELTERLAFSALGAGSWAAFNDRLWDLLNAPGEPPVAVVIEKFDRLKRRDLHAFLRCIHNLLSMTEGVGLADERADLQVEYLFVGDW